MMEKIVCSKDALDFLLFSYFGITLEGANKTSKLIDVSIKKAYADATMQGAYNTLLDKKDETAKKSSNEAKKKGIELLKKNLEQLHCIQETQTSFEDWHKDLCEKLVVAYADELKSKKEEFFSYGNAQKWVNMTMKYLYLMCGIFAESTSFMQRIGNTVMELSEHLHIPVDSYIIEAVWDEEVYLPLKKNKTREQKYKNPAENVVAWSQWNGEQYRKFQQSLRESVLTSYNGTPLEWENKAWLKVAKERRKNRKKRTHEYL